MTDKLKCFYSLKPFHDWDVLVIYDPVLKLSQLILHILQCEVVCRYGLEIDSVFPAILSSI